MQSNYSVTSSMGAQNDFYPHYIGREAAVILRIHFIVQQPPNNDLFCDQNLIYYVDYIY